MAEKVPEKVREKALEKLLEVRATDARTGAIPRVKWDDSEMKSSYANVCNVASTREEVTLLFGTHQNWHSAQREVSVRLSDRIILNPYAAKRLARLLTGVVAEYEKRFGPLGTDVLPEGGVH
jgi:hypothetical protein